MLFYVICRHLIGIYCKQKIYYTFVKYVRTYTVRTYVGMYVHICVGMYECIYVHRLRESLRLQCKLKQY